MTQLILHTLRHYWRQNLSLALGVAVSTAVITGALIVGDSMRYSLRTIADLQLGQVTHVISAGDRYFTDFLAIRMEATTGYPAASLLQLEGSAASEGGRFRLPKVQILGIREDFADVTGTAGPLQDIAAGEAAVSQNLATRLNLEAGDEILLRIQKLSVIPLNAPFVSDAETIAPVRVMVTDILSEEQMGRFQLQHIQSAPFNAFLSLEFLNEVMENEGKANRVLISTSGEPADRFESALQQAWQLEDVNLNLRRNPRQNAWELTSERVFIDPPIQEALEATESNANPVLTYFVNRLARGDRSTPYSFVSTLPEIAPGEIVLNQWLADDLQAKPGDTVALDYFVIGPLRELEERTAPFVVREIVPMSGKWTDATIMPDIPGLSDVGNCSDWETGVPVDLERIRDKDEDYWDRYGGAPKAYISYEQARELWANRFGAATLIRFPEAMDQTEMEELLHQKINLSDLGFRTEPVREAAGRAAAGGVDFSQLFLGLSFFLLLAGLLLTVLLFSLNTESRMTQIGTFSVLGFTDGRIRRMLLLESLLVAATGSAGGLLLASGYNQLVFSALNNIWSAIVRTQTLITIVRADTLALGFGISLFVSFFAIYWTLRRLLRQEAHALQTATIQQGSAGRRALKNALAAISGIAALGLVGWSYAQSEFQNAGLFFAGGGLLLMALLLFLHNRLQQQRKPADLSEMKLSRLIGENITRNYNRSFLVVALFAIGTFIVIATGMNRQDVFSSATNRESGTGGFLFFAESTVPVLRNLNDPAVRFETGLTGDYPIVQIRTFQGDDASCLNLNRVSTPAIWGVRPGDLSGRFSFVSGTDEINEEHPWQSLAQPLGPNTIPAIADQTVIQWGLGLKVGDTLQYVDERGQALNLKLIGGLANSIFQGSVLIDDRLFLEHFPSNSGARVFLVDGQPEESEAIREELDLAFRDHGWGSQPAAERLATFNSVTNTYLSIFMILGGLGLLIGTIGLGIVMARNLLSRRDELGILLALGFRRHMVSRMVTLEHFYLLLLGVGIGLLCSVVAALPVWLNPNIPVSPLTVLVLIGLVFAGGLLWILLFSRWMMREETLVDTLVGD